jgi:hypothetical protein
MMMHLQKQKRLQRVESSLAARRFAKSSKRKPSIIKKTPDMESSVGARGFEPPTSCTPCKRASRTAPRPDQQNEL